MSFLPSLSNPVLPAGTSIFHSAIKAILGFCAAASIAHAQNVSAVAAGDYQTLFIKTDKTLWATGYNIYGQLGDSTTVTASRSSPIQVTTGAIFVATGFGHTALI